MAFIERGISQPDSKRAVGRVRPLLCGAALPFSHRAKGCVSHWMIPALAGQATCSLAVARMQTLVLGKRWAQPSRPTDGSLPQRLHLGLSRSGMPPVYRKFVPRLAVFFRVALR